MLTEKDYCDYETCVALKEMGFIGQGRCYYDLDKEPNKLRHFGIQVLTTRSAGALNFVLAVHLYEAQKWLREEKGFDIVVKPLDKTTLFMGGEKYFWMVYLNYERVSGLNVPCTITYEESLFEGIKEAVKILKEK